MEIRKAQTEELDQILLFYEALTKKLADVGYDLPWRVGIYPTRDMFETAVAQQTMYLCTEHTAIVAAAILNHAQGDGYHDGTWQCSPSDHEIGVIHLLCTDPDLHGNGIGRRMVEHLIREAQLSGIKSLRLDVLHYNTPAVKLYEQAGFLKKGEVHLCYPTTGPTVFWLYELVL